MEYYCHHCGALPPDLVRDAAGAWPKVYAHLFSIFAGLREAWGQPIPITSGYRCPAHEREVTGSNIGPHILGLALDLGIGVSDQLKFAFLVTQAWPELRMGTNTNPGAVHIHIDVAYLAFPRWTAAFVPGARWIE
jgi:uncharacterized protein YcbK (DUF882 family)